jgi:hypothetical protein
MAATHTCNPQNERRKEEDPSANKLGDDPKLIGEALLSTTDIRWV